ncbi:MAG: bifunctional phosphoribosylaminoimidazolecarboxamide formyltransferase/IMP cyclohydrolase [Firmicutes bacterium]|nr:bifunctional phosphoribosylaminoimidazolecarboxamide formyltransferase/IMP cyclohydrolase [Bacillota bacterium]
MAKRALVSVSDKTGLIEFCKGLTAQGFEIVSTGGTAAALTAAGIKNIGVSEITGFPECLDGRVKTLHPFVHAGLLARRDEPAHMKQLTELKIDTIDLVAVNLYPFKSAISKPGCTLEDAVENIDIGGPTMLRSAAKNYRDVLVVCDPSDYSEVLKRMADGTDDTAFRFGLMYKVFAHTAQYDALISGYFANKQGIAFPDTLTLTYEKAQGLRYGENPQQQAAFYKECYECPGSVAFARQLHGKELSFNNINDANGALELVREFSEPAVVAVKHTNPCGVAVGEDIYDAYIKAYQSDPVSIFGGILAINREIDERTALEISKIFIEVVVAPSFSAGALAVLTKKQNIRLLELPSMCAPLASGTRETKKVSGGLLAQDADTTIYEGLETATHCTPTPDELRDLEFAFRVVKHTKSNAIVLARGGATVGLGVGQTNRIWAAKQAIEHAGARANGAVMASDAFFPFPDCAEAAAEAGITAIIQPFGSVNDADSVAVCDKHSIAMVSSKGYRHFKH